jgi:hypothetical protein
MAQFSCIPTQSPPNEHTKPNQTQNQAKDDHMRTADPLLLAELSEALRSLTDVHHPAGQPERRVIVRGLLDSAVWTVEDSQFNPEFQRALALVRRDGRVQLDPVVVWCDGQPARLAGCDLGAGLTPAHREQIAEIVVMQALHYPGGAGPAQGALTLNGTGELGGEGLAVAPHPPQEGFEAEHEPET